MMVHELDELLVPATHQPFYDPEELRIRLEMEGSVEIVAKPAGYVLRGTQIELNIMGIRATAHLAQLGSTPQEVLMRIRTTSRWILRKVGGRVVVSRVEPVIRVGEHEYTVARELVERYPPIEVIVKGMGYRVDRDVIRLLAPRLVPIVVSEYPVHVVQMTPVESGKSFFGVWAMKVCGWFYTTAPPTPAGLFYDARTGAYGYAVTSNGIVFDEIEKWSATQIEQSGILSYLPTFLENGVVIRPTSRSMSLGVIERRVNTIWFGNCGAYEGGDEKEIVAELFRSWGDRYGALVDRMSIIHVEYKPIRILDYVTGYVLPDSIMYAVIDVVKRRDVDIDERSSLSGRRRRHSVAIRLGLARLGIRIDSALADDVVSLGWATAMDAYGGVDVGEA